MLITRSPAEGSGRRPLVLTGGPAVGKSATGRALASSRPRGAFIDVDDVRQLVVSGGEPPWRGEEGLAQQTLGVLNAGCLARRFLAAGIDVVIADVLTPRTAELFREEIPRCVIVHLLVIPEEAERRAATRRRWLTADEFRLLHKNDRASPPSVDHRLAVTSMSLHEQVAATEALWAAA